MPRPTPPSIMAGMPASLILVGHDGSPHADDALALARVFAAARAAEIVLARVVPREPGGDVEARRELDRLRELAEREHVSARAIHDSSPARGLYDLAEHLKPEVLVVGSSHRGAVGQAVVGNVALQLLNGLDRALAVAPAGYAHRPHSLGTIGVGYDGSPESRAALVSARDLAEAPGAGSALIAAALAYSDLQATPWAFAWGAGAALQELEEQMCGRVAEAAAELPAGIPHSERIEVGPAAAALLEASERLDLLVTGSRGYGPARRLLLGSVSGEVVRRAQCPVLVVPRPASAEMTSVPSTKENAVYSNIIVGYDGTPQADDALALGKLIAQVTGGSLTAVGVVPSHPHRGGADLRLQEEESEFESQLRQAAEPAGAQVQMVTSTSAARGLHVFAEESDADLLILGSARHGGAGRLSAGSVAMRLLHGAPCSVAIAPRGYAASAPAALGEIAVGYDGEAEAQVALAEAIELARASGAAVKLVTVAEPSPIVYGKGAAGGGREAVDEAVHGMMRGRLDDALDQAPADVEVEGTLVDGPAADSLGTIASEDGGVLIVGSRGFGPLRRVLLGSVSSALVHEAPCPVIVHPRPARVPETTPAPAEVGTAS
jgi:nucleotide-binding universal stress UspA family protein